MIAYFPTTTQAVLAPAKGNVWSRIQQLRSAYPNGSFFTANGKACTHGSLGICNNCSLSHNMKKNGYSGLQGMVEGWTCVAFSRFAFFYIFGIPYDTLMYNNKAPTNTKIVKRSQARPGDIFVWNNKHAAIFLGDNKFFHSNIGAPNKVSYNTGYSGTPSYIIRANNYDMIDAAPVPGNYITKTRNAVNKGNTLNGTNTLNSNEYLLSANRKFIAFMQDDGNLVVHSTNLAYWHSFTNNVGGKELKIQSDGNIHINDNSGKSVWNLGLKNVNKIMMLNNGNLAAYNSANKLLWTSDTENKGADVFFTSKADNIGNQFDALIVSGEILTNDNNIVKFDKERHDNSQIMRFKRNPIDNTYSIKSLSTGRNLSLRATANSKARAFFGRESETSIIQRFRIEKNGDRYILASQNTPRWVLDSDVEKNKFEDGTQVWTLARNNFAHQWFEIRKIDNIEEYLNPPAAKSEPAYSVVFMNNNKLLSVQTVEHNKTANAPVVSPKKGKNFVWDKKFNKVTSNLTINTQWRTNIYNVTYMNGKTKIKDVKTEHNKKVKPLKSPTKKNHTFTKWFEDIKQQDVKQQDIKYQYTKQQKPFNFNRKITENIKLYAHFAKNPTAMKSVKLSKVKNGQIKVNWKASENFGYEVEMSESKRASTFKRVKRTKKDSFTKKSLETGKRYYFRTRRYITVNGVKVYSNYSKIQSIRA